MEIQAKVVLKLPNKFYKVELKYDTFEKATYDSYLIAALIKNCKNEKEAFKYIDEITGKGSLNGHFKKLYKEISNFSENQLDGILSDSLFPVTIIDRRNHFKYYEMLNATRLNGDVYNGNLSQDTNTLKKLLMPKGDGVKFNSISFEEEDGVLKEDTYNAIFSDKGIKVDLDNGNYCSISKKDFLNVFEKEDIDKNYIPKVGNMITSGNWNVLTNEIVKTWHDKTKKIYTTNDGNYAQLTNDFIKIIEVINIFDLYFYKETKLEFSRENETRIVEALDYLHSSDQINNVKTKTLVSMLYATNDKIAQGYINWFLDRKSSKEISEFGFKLIKNGLEKGWSHSSLLEIYKIAPKSDICYLYKIDSNLDYTIDDFLCINDSELKDADLMKKKAFLSKKDEMIKSIRLWVGEMLEIREKAKQLQKDSVTKSFNDFANEYIGHFKKVSYEEMSFDLLQKEFNKIKLMYTGNYQKVKERLDSKRA